jgi:hypothetical protein
LELLLTILAAAVEALRVPTLVLGAWAEEEREPQGVLSMEQMEALTQAVAVAETLYWLADLIKADLRLVAAALAS